MKEHTCRLRVVVLSVCLFAPTAISAQDSTIDIEAQSASFDVNTGERTYEGEVIIKMEGFTLRADKVVILPVKGNQDEFKLEADGSPLELQDLPKSNLGWVRGKANKLIMSSDTGQVELHGDVHFEGSDAEVNAQFMHYNTETGSFTTKNIHGDNVSGRTRIQFKGNF